MSPLPREDSLNVFIFWEEKQKQKINIGRSQQIWNTCLFVREKFLTHV